MHAPSRRTATLVALALTATAAPLAFAVGASAVPAPTSTVFVNEIHYDNTGTDAGEFIEVANPTGRDLSGWDLVLYNGGTAAAAAAAATSYTPVRPLAGTGTLQVADYPANGIQNGSPDGVALVDDQDRVVQFLSYEGVLTAANGPAAGLTSTDIGVVEDGNGPVGDSLQLTGSGGTYGAFTWAPSATATRGAANNGQTFAVTPPPTDAVLTVTNPSPVTTLQGTAASFDVTATDPDDAVTATVGTAPAGLSAVVTGGGTGSVTVRVTVAADAPAGPATLPITFTTPEQSVSSPFVVTVQGGDACGPLPTRELAEVQGSGATSPLVGQTVRVEGVVVGDFQATGQFGGFFVQDPTPDADPLTSDALRVFTNTAPVSVGDVVRVSGPVEEFASTGLYTGSETQLGRTSTVTVCGTAPLPAALPVTLPFAETVGGVAGQERFEGARVTLAQDDLVATDLFTLGRFGEVSLTTDEVLFIPTTAEEAAANDRDRITLDDGLSGQNLPTLPYTVGEDGRTLPRAGDTLAEDVTGVFSYSFGEYRVEPEVGTTAGFTRTNPRPLAPEVVGGDVQLASFNVLNYFVDFGGQNRGATSQAELERQEAKLVAAITGFDADAVGLIEIANDDGDALTRLVAAINAAQPDPTDDYVAVQAPPLNPASESLVGGTYGTDAIRTAIIYRPSVLAPTGPPPADPALLNPADPLFPDEPVFDRPPAVQEFLPVGGDRPFTMVVNHFKSKGSTNAQCGAPDPFGGNCDDLRERQSTALLGLVEDLGAEDVALLGDFNSYETEAPIDILTAGGFTSSVADKSDIERTSYSFDGEFGSLDYVFLSDSLLPARTGADIWQINSPEAPALQYNLFNQPQLYAPDAFASSDHDAEVVGLELVEDIVLGCELTTVAPRTVELQGDCFVAETLALPERTTLDGNGFTVTAVAPAGGRFTGPVVRIGPRSSVSDLVVDGSRLPVGRQLGLEVADRSDVLRVTARGFGGDGTGIAFTGKGGTITSSRLLDNGCGLSLTQDTRVVERRNTFTGNAFDVCVSRQR